MHAAQGVTADTTHAMLGDRTTEQDTAPMDRTSCDAAAAMKPVRWPRDILTNPDGVPVTAHQIAARTPYQLLGDPVPGLHIRRGAAV